MGKQANRPSYPLWLSGVTLLTAVVFGTLLIGYTGQQISYAATPITTVSDRQLVENTQATQAWKQAASITLTEDGSWLILTSFELSAGSTSIAAAAQLLHNGTTEIAELQYAQFRHMTAATSYRSSHWMTRIDKAGANVVLDLNFMPLGATTASIRNALIVAIRLDDLGTEDTDWVWNSNDSAVENFDAIYDNADGIILTEIWTPATTEDWIVLANAEGTSGGSYPTSSNQVGLRLSQNDEATTYDEWKERNSTLSDWKTWTSFFVASLTASEQKFEIQAKAYDANTKTSDARRARFFAIKASAFDQVVSETNNTYTQPKTGSGTWVNKVTASYTPNQIEDVLILGRVGFRSLGTIDYALTRLQEKSTTDLMTFNDTAYFVGDYYQSAAFDIATVSDIYSATIDVQTDEVANTVYFGDARVIFIPLTTATPAPATLHIVKTVINDNGGTSVASDFTIDVAGTNVSTPSFAGSEAGVDVTLDAGTYAVTETSLPGYLQSGSGDCSGTIAAGETKICTITNDDVAPQLIVNKVVVNDNGGVSVLADFPLFIDGGSVVSGVATTITIGLHTVSETADSDYTSVIGGDCAVDGTITLALGDVKTCTITNNDIAPSLDSGSTYYPPVVPPLIDIVKVPSPLALPDGPGTVEYTYTLHNAGTVPVSDVTTVGDTCSPITLISGDTNTDGKLDVNETWIYTCSTTLSETKTNTVTATGWANGINATDIATATVIVGIPVVPPLIHVTKSSSPLTLFAGGGDVTYTNQITNPGTVALFNVQLTNDECGPVNYISGDTNIDSQLDTTETWTYTCQVNLTQTTTNTATATGEANGLTARDFAIATVLVAAAPGFPNTGLPDNQKHVAYFGILALLAIGLTALTLRSDKSKN